jgi:ribonuclease HI
MKMILRTDGGARGNPGPAAAGVVIENSSGNTLFAAGFFLGEATNNVAEYQAIRKGVRQVLDMGGRNMVLYSDSELIVKQLRGEYRVKNPTLRECYQQVTALLDELDGFEINHVYREGNSEADALVNRSLDIRADVGDVAGSSTTEKPSPSIDRTDLQGFLQIREKIRFSSTTPHIEIFHQNDNFTGKLICLDRGQSITLEELPDNCSLLLLRGKGMWQIEAETIAVETGHWFYLQAGQSMRVLADQGEQVVLLATETK